MFFPYRYPVQKTLSFRFLVVIEHSNSNVVNPCLVRLTKTFKASLLLAGWGHEIWKTDGVHKLLLEVLFQIEFYKLDLTSDTLRFFSFISI